MNYKTKEQVMARVREHYDWAVHAGYEVVAVFLQGSFNYGWGMVDAESDVDTKAWVVPTIEDLALNRKPVSFTKIMENGEHCDVKDVREYMRTIRKQNVNFVEVLFTEYMVVNPKYAGLVKVLTDNREKIARYNTTVALHCMVGMARQKQVALCHPYEGLKEKLKKYGYDGKQLSHAFRMKYMMEDYLAGKPYSECLVMNENRARWLMILKRHKSYLGHEWLPKEEAITLMNKIVAQMDTMVDTVPVGVEADPEVDKLLDTFVVEVVRKFLSESI